MKSKKKKPFIPTDKEIKRLRGTMPGNTSPNWMFKKVKRKRPDLDAVYMNWKNSTLNDLPPVE